MSISAAQVKELRELTGAGMMDCKAALAATDGDMEAGGRLAARQGHRQGRQEGRPHGRRRPDRRRFRPARSGRRRGEFRDRLRCPQRRASRRSCATSPRWRSPIGGETEAVANAKYPGSDKTVTETIKDAVGTIGENMSFRRSAKLTVAHGAVATYVHNAVADGLGKLGVLVAIETTGNADAAKAFARQVAMHVAATNPLALTAEEVDPAAVAREKAIFAEQARESGKPEAIIEKMVEGRMRKFYEEVVLLKQAFVINPDLTVEKALKDAEKDIGAPAKITGFLRFALGEGIEKETTDFAAEVAAAVKK